MRQFVTGLAQGFSALGDGDEDFLFLCLPGRDAWIRPFIAGHCDLVHTFSGSPEGSGLRPPELLSRLAIGVMHFTFQDAFATSIPSIYHPHDLQHIHLPHFFTDEEIARRNSRYRAFCEQARYVVTAGAWTRADVITQFDLPEEKVVTIPMTAPPQAQVESSSFELDEIRSRYDLPNRFVFYPAQAWPHKNHIRLLDALASLRDNGTSVSLVCTGGPTEHLSDIYAHITKLHLSESVRFLGYVDDRTLNGLYRLCDFLVMPSLFESASFPVLEALALSVPFICSNVNGLSELVGDRGILIDPTDTAQLAQAINRMWNNKQSHRNAKATPVNSRDLPWDQIAQQYRALYRHMLGDIQTAKDMAIVERLTSNALTATG